MNEIVFWQIIEDAWTAAPALQAMRASALQTNDPSLIEDLTGKVYGAITNNIRQILLGLDKEGLTKFNHMMEERLFHIDRKEIHQYTSGSDDGFLYCRCFIVGMGKAYYDMIDNNPAKATSDAEAEIVGFIGYVVYKELFGEDFVRYSVHSIETCANARGWDRKTNKETFMNDEIYGIDQDHAHKRAVALIPEEFFWDCSDELAPFGSDEGDEGLAEFRNWRKANPDTPTIECLKWTIESVGEMTFADYNENLLQAELIQRNMNDPDYDDQQYIFTLDISVIATGFGQLVDEGVMDTANKPIIKIAIERQIIWAQLIAGWEHTAEYVSNLNVLKRALEEA
ncbi:uncharacterized protein YfeS [Chitinophaga niastensis]|uniref:Uncharacterized protein YfeS n=1 Tax=Chitinophaga niastensis TaxID=536980 RepID=A0A2P8HKF6_CHINA|nr:DUF4240 domain-containing protein [Chitinophaga niastensis]PSL46701.1 uncharacterized protein YfeS [Chitinophaga niastensis]